MAIYFEQKITIDGGKKMAVNLVKGQKIDLTKGNAALNQIMVGLGWDPVGSKGFLSSLFSTKQDIDCDASVIMVGSDGKITSNKDVVYFGNLIHPSHSVKHMGDNLTGDGDGDDEQIFVELKSVPANIEKLIFVVNIYDCIARHQDFGMIQNAFIRIVDMSTHKELVRFDLTDDYKGFTALEVGEVYRHNGEWKFAALGNGTHDAGLKTIVSRHA